MKLKRYAIVLRTTHHDFPQIAPETYQGQFWFWTRRAAENHKNRVLRNLSSRWMWDADLVSTEAWVVKADKKGVVHDLGH